MLKKTASKAVFFYDPKSALHWMLTMPFTAILLPRKDEPLRTQPFRIPLTLGKNGDCSMAAQIKVLIVDDNFRARESLKTLLGTWPRVGEIREAENGEEALALVSQSAPDLLLMDAHMPVMDGIEATQTIKVLWPHVQIIVLSMFPDYRTPALAAGAQAFTNKADLAGQLRAILAAVTSFEEQSESQLEVKPLRTEERIN
jgi:CheY-like chemotaxis protein